MRISGSHRRVIWVGAGLVAVFAFAEVAARITMTTTPEAIRWYDEAAQLKIEQMDDLDDVDVVFAGTSMAWQAFVPSVFDDATGTASYNAGLNGGTPEVMERWLLEEVVPRTHPTTVIWGLSSLDLAPNYGAQQRDVYDEALATRTGWLADTEQRASRWSSLVANRTVLRSMNNLYGNGADLRETGLIEADERLGDDGERLDFRTDTSERQRQIMQARLRDFAPDANDIATISHTIRTLQADGIEVVLVHLPVPQGFIDAHPSGQADYAFVEVTLDALASTTGSRFLNLSIAHADNRYIDLSHLDEQSAARFSLRVAAELQSTRDDRGTTTAPDRNSAMTDRGDDCTTETILDDYGFEIEITDCLEPSTTGSDDADSDLSIVDIQAGGLSVAIADRDRLCSAGENPAPALQSIAAAIDALAAQRTDTPDEQLSVEYALIQAAVINSDTCVNPSSDATIAEATAAITGALDRLYGLLNINEQRASALSRHRDRITTMLWMRDARARGIEIDGLIIGNSVSRTGIDPVQLGELTGTTIGQASIAGVSPETIGPWLDEVIGHTDPDTIYWAVSYYDIFGLCRVDQRIETMGTFAELRTGAFAGLVDEERRRNWDQFFGPEGWGAYGDSRILDSIDLTNAIPSLGRDKVGTEPRPDLLQIHQERVGTFWTPGQPCTERTPFIAEHIADLRAQGRTVVMFVIPPNPVFADPHPGGIDAYFEAAADIADKSKPNVVVPLDIVMGAEHFLDGVHILESGRTLLTAALWAGMADENARLTPPD